MLPSNPMRLVPFMLFAAALPAQIVEIPALTVAHAVIDVDAVGPAGPTSRTAVNAAGTNGGADLVRIVPATNAQSIQGVYDTGTALGRGLGFDAATGSLLLVDPNGTFDPFDLRLDFAGPSTEFGLAIADWEGPMIATFFRTGGVVATFTTSPFDAQSGRRKFLQARGLTFDRVDLRASVAAGNWLVAELHVQSDSGYAPYGSGCGGSVGVPRLDAAPGSTPVRGRTFTLAIDALPAGSGNYAIVYGFSRTTFPGLGALPFDLTRLGAPGCALLCDLIATASTSYANGSARFTLTVPDIARLEGARFYNQAYALAPGANALGVVVTNGGAGRIR